MHDRLDIHEYFGIDDMTIWAVITTNLPPLKSEIQEILNGL